MIIDNLLVFSSSQDITSGSASGVLATGSIDLGVAGLSIGTGRDLYIVAEIITAMTGTNPNALKIDVITDSDGAMATAPVILQTTEKFPTNSVAGTRIVAKLAPSSVNYKRYLGLKYTSDNTLTTCVISAALVEGAALEGTTYAQSSGAAIASS